MRDTERNAETWPVSTGSHPEPVAARYEFLDEVGHGAMGVVFRGRHRQLDKEVAIKVVKSGLASERFLREARLLAKVDSPHVVRVHDFDILPDGAPILVMELIEGSNLEHHIDERGGPLDETITLQWMRQVAGGLLAAAEQGIIHRDVKPANICVDHQQHARIMDFGLSRLNGEGPSLTMSSSILGTPYYMAPEQAENPRSVDTRADIYSFGATFYHALTGRPPFDGESAFAVLFKHKTEPLVAPHSLNTALSRVTCEVLERCLAKSPDHRFSSFADVLRCLTPLSGATSPWDPTEETELLPYLGQFRGNREAYIERTLPAGTQHDYAFPGGRKLQILVGDIVTQNVDAIVSSDNSHLSMDYGTALAINRAAGESVRSVARQFVPVLPGRLIVTRGGKLSARYVFHAATNGYAGRSFEASRDIVSELVAAIMYHADTLSVRSVAIPLLGAGGAGLPDDVALDAIFLALARFLHRGITTVSEARIVLHPKTQKEFATSIQWSLPPSRDESAALNTYRVGDEPVPLYTLVKELGRGSMGIVWLAQTENGFQRALKVINLTQRGGRKEWRGLRLVKQRELLHGNLLTLIDYWLKDAAGHLLPDTEHGQSVTKSITTLSVARASTPSGPVPAQVIVAMELGHKTLNNRMRECHEEGLQGLPPEELLSYMEQAARGLDYLHREGIVHRDIKPGNIMLVGDVAKVSDYGLIVTTDADLLATSNAFTPLYASPEAVNPETNVLTGRSDQYSLAVTYVELRTGRMPYTTETAATVYAAKETGRYDLTRISKTAVRQVLMRALARDPNERFSSCSAFVRALTKAEQKNLTIPLSVLIGVAVGVLGAAAGLATWIMSR
jgi:eukaryotic-like serine/threonine-protein kinase